MGKDWFYAVSILESVNIIDYALPGLEFINKTTLGWEEDKMMMTPH